MAMPATHTEWSVDNVRRTALRTALSVALWPALTFAQSVSTATIAVSDPVKAVFEVNAGTARRIGLKPGGRLIHPIFKSGG